MANIFIEENSRNKKLKSRCNTESRNKWATLLYNTEYV